MNQQQQEINQTARNINGKWLKENKAFLHSDNFLRKRILKVINAYKSTYGHFTYHSLMDFLYLDTVIKSSERSNSLFKELTIIPGIHHKPRNNVVIQNKIAHEQWGYSVMNILAILYSKSKFNKTMSFKEWLSAILPPEKKSKLK